MLAIVDKAGAGEFYSIFRAALDVYLQATGFIASFFGPILEWIAASLGITLELNPHWTDILVLSGLYLSRDYLKSIEFKLSVKAPGSRVVFGVGVICCLATSLIVGSISFESSTRIDQFLIAVVPCVGVMCYEFADSINHALNTQLRAEWAKYYDKNASFRLYLLRLLRGDLILFGVPISIMTAWTLTQDPSATNLFALGSLLLFVVWLALYWIGFEAITVMRSESTTKWADFRSGYHMHLGWSILSTILLAFAFFAANGILGAFSRQ